MDRLKRLFRDSIPHPKIKDFFNWSFKLLSWTGFDFEDSKGSSIRDKAYRIIRKIFYALVVVNLILAIISSGASIISPPIDLDKVSLTLPVVASSLMIILKSIVITSSKADVMKIVNFAKDRETFQNKAYEKNTIMFRRFLYGYTLSLLCPMIVNILTPITKYLTTGEKTFSLEMKFPFDATTSFIYPFILLWTSWNLINGLLIFLSTDVLIFGSIRIISTEFEILRDKFEQANVNESEQFQQLMQNHNELYDVCKQLEKIFSLSFFYKFIISSFVICFTAFQCSTSSDMTRIIVNMAICIANFNQIGLQCFFGQMLKNSSEGISDSMYACKWERSTNIQARKSLIVCIARAQRHVALTTLKFSEISYEQFAYVLTTTYSYFTLLRQVYLRVNY